MSGAWNPRREHVGCVGALKGYWVSALRVGRLKAWACWVGHSVDSRRVDSKRVVRCGCMEMCAWEMFPGMSGGTRYWNQLGEVCCVGALLVR